MKNKFALIIIILIIIGAVAGFFLTRTSENQNEREDYIAFINQEADIIDVVAKSENISLRKVGEEAKNFYSNEIKKSCRSKYYYKDTCTLKELNLIELKKLRTSLEKYIQIILRLQNEGATR